MFRPAARKEHRQQPSPKTVAKQGAACRVDLPELRHRMVERLALEHEVVAQGIRILVPQITLFGVAGGPGARGARVVAPGIGAAS